MIHCPECSNGNLTRLNPTILNGFERYFINGKEVTIIETCKDDECIVCCRNCGHYHTMKIKNFLNPTQKSKSIKIKGYGKYHY